MANENGHALNSSGNETFELPYGTLTETRIHFTVVISSAVTIHSAIPFVAENVIRRRDPCRGNQNAAERKSLINQKEKEEQGKAAPVG